MGIILCFAEEEAPCFRPADVRSFAVRLSYRSDADEITAQGEFETFIRSAGQLAFAVYRLDANGSLYRVDDVTVFREPQDPSIVDRFLEWLPEQKPTGAAQFFGSSTWTGQVEITASTLDARAVVLGAAGQLAPVPQRLGLAVVVHVPVGQFPVPDGAVVVIPHPPTAVLPHDFPADGAGPGGVVKSNVGGQGYETTITATLLEGSTKVDALTGFIHADHQSQAAFSLGRRLAERGHAALDAHLPLGEITWPPTQGSQQTLPEAPDIIERAHARRLGWRAIMSIVTALDAPILAITLPGAEARDGAVLAPFLDLLQARLPPASGVARAKLRRAARTALAAAAFRGSPGSTAAQRESWINAVLAVAGQPPVPIDIGASTWLQALLRGYILQSGPGWNEVASRGRDIVSTNTVGAATTIAELMEALENALNVALGELRDTLTGEAGFEAVVARWLSDPDFAQVLARELGLPDRGAVEAAVSDYRTWLAQGANAAMAGQQTLGSLINDQLAPASPGGDPWAEYVANLRALALLSRRYQIDTLPQPNAPRAEWFKLYHALLWPISDPSVFFAALPAPHDLPSDWTIPVPGQPVEDARRAIEAQASRFGTRLIEDLFPSTPRRVVADSAPSPVAFRICADSVVDDDDTYVDEFQAQYSGLSLLLSRRDSSTTRSAWSYGCLAEVMLDATAIDGGQTLAPLPPAESNGRRELFIPFDGIPFSTQAFAATLPGGIVAQQAGWFETDYPAQPNIGAVVPRLAYGTVIGVTAHAMSRAGSLPSSLQGTRPWLPTTTPQVPGSHTNGLPDFIEYEPYRRRTLVGAPRLGDVAGQRIGVVPADTYPLLIEHPRLVISSVPIDLARSTDGTGALRVPEIGETEVFRLEDLQAYAPSGQTLTLQIAPMTDPEADFSFPDQAGRYIELQVSEMDALAVEVKQSATGVEVTLTDDGAPLGNCFLPAGTSQLWLRARLDRRPPAACLSLLDPSAGWRSADISRPASAEALLLLGLTDSKAWQTPFSTATELQVKPSWVTYEDWFRWISNPELHREVFGEDEGQARSAAVRAMLLTAHIDRLEKPYEQEKRIFIDQLPDPAVRRMELEVCPMGGLGAAPEVLRRQLGTTAVQFDVPTLGELLHDPALSKAVDDRDVEAFFSRLRALLTRTIRIHVESGIALTLTAESTSGRAEITIGEGMHAKLSVRPLVPHKYFTRTATALAEVFDPALLQRAVARIGDWIVFEGQTLDLESMTGAPFAQKTLHPWQQTRTQWMDATKTAFGHRGQRQARGYTINTVPDHLRDWRWRQLAFVTVHTQRWHFNGRPIQHWFAPKGRETGMTSVRVVGNEADAFERQAFAHRDPRDAVPESVRLKTPPEMTCLLQVSWDPPGATYFRHRFSLHSRYAGAMTSIADGVVDAWPEDTDGSEGWMRVVMLADRSLVSLTRPQLRALIPLTASPDTAEANATAPVAALLQEGPFAFGGLADRVVAEIRTGVGYAYNGAQIGPLDVRKEVGPDPRLSYEALPLTRGAGLRLNPIGPVGLTFEPGVSAPAFPNTMYLLSPYEDNDLAGGLLNEHLVSVALRRYLDPQWLVSEVETDEDHFSGSWWCDGESRNRPWSVQLKYRYYTQELATCRLREGRLFVTIDRALIDETSQAGPMLLVHASANARLAFLHTPLEERRASLAVFEVGNGIAPQLLGSLEWSVPRHRDIPKLKVLAEDGTALGLSRTSSSEVTAIRWTKLLRDFDALRGIYADGAHAAPVFENLCASHENGHIRIEERYGPVRRRLWLRPDQQLQPYPLHAQRHLAILLLREIEGPGPALTIPMGVRMLPGEILESVDESVTAVQVLEFEVPARILGHIPGSWVPEDFNAAHFDLVAIGYGGDSIHQHGATFSLFGRMIASTGSLEELKTLSLNIQSVGNPDLPWSLALQIPQIVKDAEAFVLTLRCPKGGGRIDVDVVFIDKRGRSHPVLSPPVVANGLLGQEPQFEGMRVAFDVPPAHEVWIELALLASEYSATPVYGFESGLDFSWCFGGARGDATTELSTLKLRELREVQARLIAASKPIPVHRDRT